MILKRATFPALELLILSPLMQTDTYEAKDGQGERRVICQPIILQGQERCKKVKCNNASLQAQQRYRNRLPGPGEKLTSLGWALSWAFCWTIKGSLNHYPVKNHFPIACVILFLKNYYNIPEMDKTEI